MWWHAWFRCWNWLAAKLVFYPVHMYLIVWMMKTTWIKSVEIVQFMKCVRTRLVSKAISMFNRILPWTYRFIGFIDVWINKVSVVMRRQWSSSISCNIDIYIRVLWLYNWKLIFISKIMTNLRIHMMTFVNNLVDYCFENERFEYYVNIKPRFLLYFLLIPIYIRSEAESKLVPDELL